MSSNKRLLIIGLDGATGDIIEPLIAQGSLPNLARLMQQGVWNTLLSTVPPATFPAWTTCITGKNPGKHGLFDFTERVQGTYRVRFVNSTFRRAKSLWQILSEEGLRVGVMGLPATYPPEVVNGFMISGFDSPVAMSIDSSFVYPEKLLAEIKEQVGDYKISELQETVMDKQWYYDARQKIFQSLKRKADTALYLYRKEPWDCFMIHFGETDTGAHHFWKFHDPSSPRYCPVDDSLANAIRDVYRRVDSAIGEFTENLWENTQILLVSDHGSGGIGDKAISLNQWLCQEGYLHVNQTSSLLEKGLSFSKQWGLTCLPASFQEKVFRSPARFLAQRMESSARFGGIVWKKTAAFSEDLNYFPSIHINLCGREPEGNVSQGTEYERLRENIIEKLLTWQDPEAASPIVKRAWKREEVYSGHYVHLAPDIILELNTPDNYSYLCLPHKHFHPGQVLKKLHRKEMCGARSMSMSGSHRPEGVFIVSGEHLCCSGKMKEAVSLQDVCPTILSFFGLPVPDDLDGRPLNIFKGSSPPTYKQPVAPCAVLSPAPIPYTAEQEQSIEKKLQRLGYRE